jgi:hypothetical protein
MLCTVSAAVETEESHPILKYDILFGVYSDVLDSFNHTNPTAPFELSIVECALFCPSSASLLESANTYHSSVQVLVPDVRGKGTPFLQM